MKKLIKIFFIILLLYIKMLERLWKEARGRNRNLSEKAKGKKNLKTDIKNFLKKKKKRKDQYHRECNKNLSEEEKEKKVEYMENYYLAHKK